MHLEDQFWKFIEDTDQRLMLLRGAQGTGKTSASLFLTQKLRDKMNVLQDRTTASMLEKEDYIKRGSYLAVYVNVASVKDLAEELMWKAEMGPDDSIEGDDAVQKKTFALEDHVLELLLGPANDKRGDADAMSKTRAEEVEELLQWPICMFLDGLDEIAGNFSREQLHDVLEQHRFFECVGLRADRWRRLKMVLSCREEFLIQHNLLPKHEEHRIAADGKLYTKDGFRKFLQSAWFSESAKVPAAQFEEEWGRAPPTGEGEGAPFSRLESAPRLRRAATAARCEAVLQPFDESQAG
eukprot:gene6406-47327_t